MVDTGELAKYLNDQTCKEGDKVKIMGEGLIEEVTQDNGKVKKILNLPVELSGSASRKLIYTPGVKALKILQRAWGFETTAWVGKEFSIKFVIMQVGQNEINVIRPTF